MAKRFIDTNMFNDDWVFSLSKDAKLFFIYYITTCDHAGILKLNKKLCELQTGLKSIDTLIEELGKSIVTVKENVYFMPRFIKFQYPKFPQSNVKQQDSALKILISYNLFDENNNSYLTLNKELTDSYDSDNVNEYNIYKKINAKLFIYESEFKKLIDLNYTKPQIDKVLESIENYKNNKKYNSLYLTAKAWLEKEFGKPVKQVAVKTIAEQMEEMRNA